MAVKKEQKRFRDVVDRFSPYGVKYDAADIPAIAYHYTDAAGLVGMLSTHKVRATEFRFLNDRSEVRHTLNLVRDLLNEQLGTSPGSRLAGFLFGHSESPAR